MVKKETLQKMTRRELSEYCKRYGIKGYSGKTKADRVKLILKYSKSKSPEKITIKEFIDKNRLYFYEWQMVENIRYKLEKRGFSNSKVWKWQSTIELGRFANHKFKAYGYIWETKSGVFGAKGLRMGNESPGHVKIRIVEKSMETKKFKIINGEKYTRGKYEYSSIERAEAYAKLLNEAGKETIIDKIKKKGSDGSIYTYYFYWIGPKNTSIKKTKRVPYITKKDLSEYIKKFKIGGASGKFDGTSDACVPIAEVLRDKGYGTMETGQIGEKGGRFEGFDHYWIRTKDNKIIDLTLKKEFRKNKTYLDIEKVKTKSKYLYGKEEYDFWKNRIKYKI